jgi:hypothetical protein
MHRFLTLTDGRLWPHGAISASGRFVGFSALMFVYAATLELDFGELDIFQLKALEDIDIEHSLKLLNHHLKVLKDGRQQVACPGSIHHAPQRQGPIAIA